MEYLIVLPVVGFSVFSIMEYLGIKISFEEEEDKLYNYYRD